MGFHPGHGDHSLGVKIYQKPGCTQVPFNLPSVIKTMSLEVVGQSSGPDFYQYDQDPFNRIDGDAKTSDGCQIWTVEIFYPEGYGKNGSHYTSWLHVKDGRFYTLCRTESTFNLVNIANGNELGGFGHVARFMAAALDVKQDVSLQINGLAPIPLKYQPGVSYQIIFPTNAVGRARGYRLTQMKLNEMIFISHEKPSRCPAVG